MGRCSFYYHYYYFGILKAHVNAKVVKGNRTALMIAAAKGYADVLRVLLSHGASVHAADENGNFAIHFATIHGQLECVKLLMDRGSLANVGNSNFINPLMLAARYGRSHIIKYLLRRGVNLSCQLNKFMESELTFAVRKGRLRVVLLFLKTTNPNVDRKAELNRALSIAIKLGRLKTSKVLIKFGADINSIDEGSKSSVNLAILRSGFNLTDYRISNEAGLTPLMFAIQMERVDIVRTLIKAGADIHARYGNTGQTALEMARKAKNKDILKVFEKELRTCIEKSCSSAKS
ncbi:unnamed protein product [Rodentolepis nana]|uniref:ANK_REP_REGION domain-containing protein n=1 Tax=Rodentolepis nana TaxID=102285 RepID=A0A0R3U097_RODNA|nr:unnamed protein product [Rodentolepis nana]